MFRLENVHKGSSKDIRLYILSDILKFSYYLPQCDREFGLHADLDPGRLNVLYIFAPTHWNLARVASHLFRHSKLC